MGMYGERVGALHIVCGTKEAALNVMSQMKIFIRCNYSSPPIHGGRIVSRILNNDVYFKQWLKELTMVTDRMNKMRKSL